MHIAFTVQKIFTTKQIGAANSLVAAIVCFCFQKSCKTISKKLCKKWHSFGSRKELFKINDEQHSVKILSNQLFAMS